MSQHLKLRGVATTVSFKKEQIARLKAEFLIEFAKWGSASEAARRVGTHCGSVAAWLKAAGLRPTNQTGPGIRGRRPQHPAKAEYLRLRGEGLSNSAASGKVGINPPTGRDWQQGIRHTANARIYPDGRVVNYNSGMTQKQAAVARLEKSIDSRVLALVERERICDLVAAGASIRQITRELH